jgi:hypothetical protein
MPFFEHFYPFIKENFNKNFNKFLEIADKKNQDFKSQIVNFKTGFYRMNINIDYNKLIEKLNKTKEEIDLL